MSSLLLPENIISLDGQLVDLSSEVWQIRASAAGGRLLKMKWSKLKDLNTFASITIAITKCYIADRLTHKKPPTVVADLYAIKVFCKWIKERGYTDFIWSEYRSQLAEEFLQWCVKNTANKGNSFSRIRVFYRWGVINEICGFNLSILRKLEATIAIGNSKGHHVRFRHPTKGPLSADEKELILRAINKETGSDQDRALIMLCIELGSNPNSLIRLKEQDLKKYGEGTKIFYQLDVPRVKKRSAISDSRRRSISSRLGKLLESLKQDQPDEMLLHWLNVNSPEANLNHRLKNWAYLAGIISPRTEDTINLNSRRFRYTLGTHLAEEGASRYHIADILDHTDLQNVDVYVETTPKIVDAVAKATDSVVEPLVDRFMGRTTNSLDEALQMVPNNNALIPAIAPHISLLNVGGIGACGRNTAKEGLCQLMPPLSCYLCHQFVATKSGPHREVLESINNYLKHHRDTADARILMQLNDIKKAIELVVTLLGDDNDNSVG